MGTLLEQVRKALREKFYAQQRRSCEESQAAPEPADPLKQAADDPAERVAIAEHERSGEFAELLQVLTAPGHEVGGCKIRGCMVDPARPKLQALQNKVGWTPGGYATRPSPEAQERKNRDRLEVLMKYRQPPAPPPGQPPVVAMYDYLCHTLFDVPTCPVGPQVEIPVFEDLEGKIVTPQWVECDWGRFEAKPKAERPSKVLRPNRYPYQLPERPNSRGAHEFQRRTQHWILWYFHGPCDPFPAPPDAEIDRDVRSELSLVVSGAGLDRCDYIWYLNPGISVPDVFHVQVFWIVPEQEEGF